LPQSLADRFKLPRFRNPSDGRVFELLGVGDGVAELAVIVEASGEEIVKQARAHLPQLRNDHFRRSNRLVDHAQDSSDRLLFRERGQPQWSILNRADWKSIACQSV